MTYVSISSCWHWEGNLNRRTNGQTSRPLKTTLSPFSSPQFLLYHPKALKGPLHVGWVYDPNQQRYGSRYGSPSKTFLDTSVTSGVLWACHKELIINPWQVAETSLLSFSLYCVVIRLMSACLHLQIFRQGVRLQRHFGNIWPMLEPTTRLFSHGMRYFGHRKLTLFRKSPQPCIQLQKALEPSLLQQHI